MWRNETNADIKEREAAANKVLDDFRLHTRTKEQPMINIFQHPIIVKLEEKKVHLAGNDEAYTSGSCCIC